MLRFYRQVTEADREVAVAGAALATSVEARAGVECSTGRRRIAAGRGPMARLPSPRDAWLLHHHAKAQGVSVPFDLIDRVVDRIGPAGHVVVATEIYAWFVRRSDELPLRPKDEPLHGPPTWTTLGRRTGPTTTTGVAPRASTWAAPSRRAARVLAPGPQTGPGPRRRAELPPACSRRTYGRWSSKAGKLADSPASPG